MIRPALPADARALAEMALLLWPENSIGALKSEFESLITHPESAVFICFQDGSPVGFAQCQLRHDYIEGTDSSPVGYLEGIFVHASFRKQGYARELLACCEAWAREQGCVEFASDCELTNADSLQFHR